MVLHSQKYKQELKLVVGSQIAIAELLVGLNLAVQYGIIRNSNLELVKADHQLHLASFTCNSALIINHCANVLPGTIFSNLLVSCVAVH